MYYFYVMTITFWCPEGYLDAQYIFLGRLTFVNLCEYGPRAHITNDLIQNLKDLL